MEDETLDLINRMNCEAKIVVQTPFVNKILIDCKEGASYQNGVVGIKPLEFVDDIADPNNGLYQARRSNDIIVTIIQQKKISFAADKYKV